MSDESGFQISADAPLHYQAQVEYFMAPFVDAMVAVSVRPGSVLWHRPGCFGWSVRRGREAADQQLVRFRGT